MKARAKPRPRQKPKETPMMRTYRRMKAGAAGAVLLFRMGDFYETFQADAEAVASVLGLPLTRRAEIAMTGFPAGHLEPSMKALGSAGYSVMVCEPMQRGVRVLIRWNSTDKRFEPTDSQADNAIDVDYQYMGYVAVFPDSYDGPKHPADDGPGSPIGSGSTPADAVYNLLCVIQ